MRFFILLFFITSLATPKFLRAQDSLAIGEWTSFLPYHTGTYLSQSQDKIIYSTKWSLFSIDKSDYSIEFYDKINLLTAVGINKHKYDPGSEQLIVIYQDSNIDIIKGSEVINIPDIKNNSTIIGDKNIYNIHLSNNGKMYLSCGFGVVEFDLESYEFGFTTFSDVAVYQTLRYESYIIAATEDGLYVYDESEHSNPADFQLWEHIGSAYQLPEIYSSIDLIEWNDNIYMATRNELYKAGVNLIFNQIYQTDNDSEISFLNKATEELMLGVNWVYDQGKVLFFYEEDNYIQSNSACANRITYAELDEQGRIWFADGRGAIRYALNKVNPCENITINSPYTNNVSDIETKGNMLYIASGGVDPSYTYIYRRDGFFIWDGEKWNNYNENTVELFSQIEIYDFFRILPHPSSEKVFIGTYYSGLVELNMENDEFKIYDKSNSTLDGKTGDPQRDRIAGLAFDAQENLWISNFGAPNPIAVFTENGEWNSFSVQSGKDLRDVTIDQYGNKWIIIDREAEGFLIYNEGNDLLNPGDDQQKIVSKNNSNLESNKVNAIEVDLDGDVWIGTSDGVVVFECGNSVFESSCQGNRRKTVLEGIPAYLLDDVNITCIETDGGNRKWFGSENGIFVQSPSGEDQIHHFTRENSPLFDNNIIDLAYNEISGTMFIATAKGVMAYRTITSGGGAKQGGDIYAYPNPVRPDYYGPIAIRGFARDSNIKITDINGQLIHESTAQGGQAIWDGHDYNGRRAASGVYLVYASTTDSFDEPDAIVTKILVIKGK